MELRLLGPLELDGRDGPIAIRAPKERALLAYLALHADEAVSEHALVDALWADDPPRTATRTLQAYLSRLRKALADAGGGEPDLTLESRPGGWMLRATGPALDTRRVDELVRVAGEATARGDAVGAALTLAEAQRCWRGRALGEFDGSPWAIAASVRLDELRLHVIEERIEAELSCGRHAALIGELDTLCTQHPLRERVWGQRMVALYRSGRQAEALRVFQSLRATLAEELGIDPSPSLVRLEQQILRQDPAMDGSSGATREGIAAAPPLTSAPALPAAVSGLLSDVFVGRREEREELDRALARATDGHLEVVLLAGEPGIGKTTLAVRFAADVAANGATVLFGRCDEETLVPFQPFVEAFARHVEATSPEVLRSQLGADAADLALLLPQLGRVLPEVADVTPTGAETERYRLFEAVPAALRAIASSQPLLVVLDDLHWADRPTLQLLQHVIRRAAATSTMVLGTYRDTDLVRTHPMAEALAEMRRSHLVTRVPVRGLDRSDVVALVAGDADPEPRDDVLGGTLHAETDGSPLFLREILRHLAETDAIVRDDTGRWRAQRRIDQLGIPEGVREVIGRRLSRLSPAANAVLLAGSVLGRELRTDVLDRVVDLTPDEILDALDEASAAGVVEEIAGAVGRFAFTHALVRHALYGELSITRRVRLHQRIGEAIEAIHGDADGAHLAELAFHFSQSAVGGTAASAITYAKRAGAYARSAVAYEDAARHYANALEVAEDAGASPEDRADLLIEIGNCLWLASDKIGARAALERAVPLVSEDFDRMTRIALGHTAAGVRPAWAEIGVVNERGIQLLEQTLELSGEGDSSGKALVLGCLAQELYFVLGARERRDKLADEAVAMARRLGDPATLGYVLSTVGLAIYRPETASQRLEQAQEAAALGGQLGDTYLQASMLVHQYHALTELDQQEAAAAVLAEAEPVLTSIREPLTAALLPAYRGGLAINEGRFAEGEALMIEAFRLAQGNRDRNGFVIFAGGLGTLLMYQGRGHLFGSLYHVGGEVFPSLDAIASMLFVTVLAEAGDPDSARQELDRLGIDGPDSITRDCFWLYGAYALAAALLAIGDRARAEWLYEMLLPVADMNASIATVGFGSARIPLGRCAITLERYDEAVTHLQRAVEASERNGWRAARVDAQMVLAIALSRRQAPGDAVRAIAVLDEMLAVAAELGMGPQVRDGSALRAQLTGGTAPSRRTVRLHTRRDLWRARASLSGRALVARWTRASDDESLRTRFGHDWAQRALFTAMAHAFQPAMAYGFEGDLSFELLPPPDEVDATTADWWTIAIRGRKATARRGRSDDAVATIRIGVADFVRLASGEAHSFRMLVEGDLRIEGDVLHAARIADMFGAVGPIEDRS